MWVFWQHDQNKTVISRQSIMKSFNYSLWCSRFIFQQMFICELSMTLCLVYKKNKKCSDQSSDMIQDVIKNKLSTCSFMLGFFCTKTRSSCLNQMHQSEHSFTPFVLLTTDSTAWTVTESECASVYCIHCRQYIINSICFLRDSLI